MLVVGQNEQRRSMNSSILAGIIDPPSSVIKVDCPIADGGEHKAPLPGSDPIGEPETFVDKRNPPSPPFVSSNTE
jgi:hypothetical protein